MGDLGVLGDKGEIGDKGDLGEFRLVDLLGEIKFIGKYAL